MRPIGVSETSVDIYQFMLRKNREAVRSDVKFSVRSDVKFSVRSDVKFSVRSDVKLNVRYDVKVNVSSDVKLNVRSDVKLNVRSDVKLNVRSDVKFSVRTADTLLVVSCLLNHVYPRADRFAMKTVGATNRTTTDRYTNDASLVSAAFLLLPRGKEY